MMFVSLLGLKKEVSRKSSQEFPGPTPPARLCCPLLGVTAADGSGPREDPRKRLKQMEIPAIFSGAVLSKCK